MRIEECIGTKRKQGGTERCEEVGSKGIYFIKQRIIITTNIASGGRNVWCNILPRVLTDGVWIG